MESAAGTTEQQQHQHQHQLHVSSLHEGGPPARKLQKVSHQGTGAGADDDDYSNSVLRKLNASSRTGQACDRCKVRKIRCDSTAGGCSPCRQAQATCKTTDRITGRATIRGHTDKLEAENLILRAKVNEQHRKLLDAGIPVDDLQIHAHNTPFASTSPVGSVSGRVSAWDAPPPPNGNHSPFGPGPASASASAPAPRTRGFFDQFSSTNVAAQPNTGLSIFRGTKMSLFGWQCDLTELVDEAEDPDSPTSYDGFMKHIFHRVPPTGPAPLPPTLEDAKPYANWYFNFLNAYTPVLHKPDMFALLAEVYTDPTPGPRQGRTVAQEVMLHMMFCQIKYQTGQRNRRTAAMDEAMAHFKYSLKFWFELCQSQTLQDVQALAMITVQLRNFPAPGAAWYATQNVLSLAVELGLHRSANAWSAIDRREMSEHEIEMRKRVFWILYGLSVGINVRLGRPAPMRADDIDIEFPRPVNDNLPEEEDRLSEFGKCTFHVGISVCRILALFGEMYTTLYTVRGFSPQQYDAHVARLEADLRTWRSLIHPELVDPDRAKGEAQVFSLFLSFFDLEFQFFLRHPVIFPPANQVQYRANLVTTLGVITKMLGVLSRIRDVKCLDVPWITVIVFLASIFTALFAQDQRKDEITQQEVTQLGDDMEVWIGILGDVAVIHGMSNRLQGHIAEIVHHVISNISNEVHAAAAAAAAKSLHQQHDAYPPEHKPYLPPQPYPPQPASYPDSYPPDPTYPPDTYPSQGLYPVPAAQDPQLPQSHVLAPQPAPQIYGYYPPAAVVPAQQQPPQQPAAEWLRWAGPNLAGFPQVSNGAQAAGSPRGEFPREARTLVELRGGGPAPQEDEASAWPSIVYMLGPGDGGRGA